VIIVDSFAGGGVCPPLAAAIVRANLSEERREMAA
jgi:hypothetical protein